MEELDEMAGVAVESGEEEPEKRRLAKQRAQIVGGLLAAHMVFEMEYLGGTG